MNPSADISALSRVDADLSAVVDGAGITLKWHGKPVFIDHRTEKRIAEALNDDLAEMRDPAPDSARARRPEWLIQIGVCTHLGCIPLEQNLDDPVGEWGGWFCACRGSVYDTAGRIRKGPAPRNLDLPPYELTSDTLVVIGQERDSRCNSRHAFGSRDFLAIVPAKTCSFSRNHCNQEFLFCRPKSVILNRPTAVRSRRRYDLQRRISKGPNTGNRRSYFLPYGSDITGNSRPMQVHLRLDCKKHLDLSVSGSRMTVTGLRDGQRLHHS